MVSLYYTGLLSVLDWLHWGPVATAMVDRHGPVLSGLGPVALNLGNEKTGCGPVAPKLG